MTRVGKGLCLMRIWRSEFGLKFLKQSSLISTMSEPISLALCISISIWSTVVPIKGVHSNVGLLRNPPVLVWRSEVVNWNHAPTQTRTKISTRVGTMHIAKYVIRESKWVPEKQKRQRTERFTGRLPMSETWWCTLWLEVSGSTSNVYKY